MAPCPRCGAPLNEGQDWCLNCGTAVTTEVAGARGWRTPIAIVGVVLALAAAALIFAFLQISDDATKVADAPVASPTPPPATGPSGPTGIVEVPTGPSGPTGIGTAPTGPSNLPTPVPTTTGSPTPFPTTNVPPIPGHPTTTPTPFPTASTTPTPTTGTVASWPAGKTAWTVVMYSGTTKPQADAKAKSLQSQGRSVGVLHSDDYSSLRSGYWVVFSGQYDTKAEATSAAKSAQSAAPGAYAREVKPKGSRP